MCIRDSLNGRLFKPCVDQGSRVKAGDLLMEFDLKQLQKEGYDMTTMVIVCNSGEYPDMDCASGREVEELEPVIHLQS